VATNIEISQDIIMRQMPDHLHVRNEILEKTHEYTLRFIRKQPGTSVLLWPCKFIPPDLKNNRNEIKLMANLFFWLH
jgi:hypothetical protein